MQSMNLSNLALDIHSDVRATGAWDRFTNPTDRYAEMATLVMMELGSAAGYSNSPEMLPLELADALVRVLDYVGALKAPIVVREQDFQYAHDVLSVRKEKPLSQIWTINSVLASRGFRPTIPYLFSMASFHGCRDLLEVVAIRRNFIDYW